MNQPKCYVFDTRKLRKEVGTTVKVAGLTGIIFIWLSDTSFAAGTGIDVGADKVYKKLLGIGKWVIIFKGGIDTIKSVADGDLPAAKRNFLGYGVTYAILWGLPWMLKEIDKLFLEMET